MTANAHGHLEEGLTTEDTMTRDACFFVEEHTPDETGAQLLRFLLGFLGFNKTPTRAALLEAVREELEDQSATALEQMSAVTVPQTKSTLHRQCCNLLLQAKAASSDVAEPTRAHYPYAQLQALLATPQQAPGALAQGLQGCQERYLAFEKRLHWLMEGTSPDQAATLDPQRDCDRFYHYLSSEFRAEDRVLDLISVNRIAQSATVSLFFHSTREAELNPVYRFYDTFLVFSNFIEWGQDSKRGRSCTQVMNRIHGRYYIPNAGMKYVLLQMAFTWLDGVERIGHRPLTDAEKQGYFHAYLRMGRTMHIEELSDDYDEMYAWYRAFNQANAEWAPIKTRTFETIVGNSLKGLSSKELKSGAFLAARVAMDDTYRRALGYADPTPEEQEAVRSVFRAAHYALDALPQQPWVRSLQDTPVRRDGYALERLGVQERSPWMPKIRPDSPNGGYPERQKPVTAERELAPTELAWLSWAEVQAHTSLDSLWIVIDGFVYDVTPWAAQHPGGQRVLLALGGKDASREFHKAKHSDATEVFKLNYRIGRVR